MTEMLPQEKEDQIERTERPHRKMGNFLAWEMRKQLATSKKRPRMTDFEPSRHFLN